MKTKMVQKVYTIVNAPFQCGGPCWECVATEIEEYERVVLPGDHAVLVVKNQVKKLFHVFLEDCGALVGSGKSKAQIVKTVKHDAETGDATIMKQQITQGVKDRDSARVVPVLEFFEKFKE